MHKARISTLTTTYIHCPNCGEKAGTIDHLLEKDYGRDFSWSCDHCGVGYSFTINSASDITIKIDQDRQDVRCLTVLKLTPKPSTLYIVLSSWDYHRSDKPFDGAEYFYNEHTCPENWARNIEKFIIAGDGDPHGTFEYVESIDLPPDVDRDDLEGFIQKSLKHLYDKK